MPVEKWMRSLRVFWGLLLSLVSLNHFFVFTVRAETIQQQNVLVLHADNPLLPANLIMDHTFNSILKLTNPRPVALYCEYLELVRFRSEVFEKQTIDLLKEKYSRFKLDLIIITDDQSCDFMIEHGKDIFPEAPIVFCGISADKIEVNRLGHNVTGNLKRLNIKSNFDTILHIQPDTKEIYVIVGTSEQDAFYASLAHAAAAEYPKKVQITFAEGLSIEDIQKKISNLTADTAVFYITIYKDGTGKTFNPRDALSLLNKTANVPIYGVSDTYLGYGMVGGNLVSFDEMSKNAAEMALQILNGRSPADIPVVDSLHNNYFDFKEMRRWGIREENLPHGSNIINKQPGPWDLYRWQIITIISAGISGLLVIIFLVFQINLKRKARTKILEVNAELGKINRRMEADIIARMRAEEALHKSEEKYRTVADFTYDWEYWVSPDQQIVYCSPSCERITGYRAEEFEKHPELLEVITHPDDRNSFIHHADHMDHTSSESHEMEIRIFTRPGDMRWIAHACCAVYSQDGTFLGRRACNRDVTVRMQDEEALKANRKRLADIIDFLPDATLVVDKERRVIVWNKAVEEMTGIPATEMIGRGNHEYAVPFYGEARPLLLDLLFTDYGDSSARYPGIIRRADTLTAEAFCKATYNHKGAWIFGKASLLRDSSGGIVGAIESLRDITRQKQLEEELLHANQTLEERVANEVQKNMEQERMLIHQSRMAAMSEMLGNIAHQWRQPLSSLGILLYNIKDACQFHELDEAYMDKAFEDGNRIIQNMSSTITDFHRFFSADNEISDFPVRDQIEKAIALVESEFQISHISIHLDAPKDLMLSGFPKKFSQAILNLFFNARDAILNHQPPVSGRVSITATERDGQGCITICDTGEGIPEDILGRIFDPYFSTRGRGRGIGLYMTKMIIERHMNGSITATKGEGGAEFRISIPLAKDAPLKQT